MLNNQLTKEQISWYNKKAILSEATGTSGAGSYKVPLGPGMRLWDEKELVPFIHKVSKYDNSELAYDSYDGKLDVTKSQSKKMEKSSKKIAKMTKNNFSQNDDDGDNLNGESGVRKLVGPFNKIVKEATTYSSEYTGPLEHGLIKWKKPSLSPFTIEVSHEHTNHAKKNKLKDLIVHHVKSLTEEKINEDLAVWFGTKKKPKGSSQPKGPWVNICRKKEGGGHPPCGRPEASDKGYPKCRAAGVAAKMTDSQKRSACQQKRKAEKTHSKSGTGNAPKMVSYKPKSKNESIENIVKKIIKEVLLRDSI